MSRDALPYAKTVGYHNQARCYGANTVGLQRRGLSGDQIGRISRAFKLLLNSKMNTSQAVEAIVEEMSGHPEIDYLVDFIKSSTRGVIK